MMPAIIRNWLSPGRTRHDARDGDPYLEALVRQLIQLRDSNSRHSMQRRG